MSILKAEFAFGVAERIIYGSVEMLKNLYR